MNIEANALEKWSYSPAICDADIESILSFARITIRANWFQLNIKFERT